MRKSRVQMTTAVLLAAMLLGGCGEAPYDLTEKEENIIVNYSAHVVAKFNSYQSEGLTYVDLEALTPEEETQETAPESSVPDTNTAEGENASPAATEPLVSAESSATLSDLFGEGVLQIDYVGARLTNNYAESAYYAMDADAGKIYLIVGIDITNTGATPVQVDFLSRAPKFQVNVNNQVTSSAELTVLTEDFSVFEGILGAGETKETVLVFQVADTVVSVDTLELFVGLDGINYQIIL